VNFRPRSATGVGTMPLAALPRSNSQSSERAMTERTTSSASLASLRAAGAPGLAPGFVRLMFCRKLQRTWVTTVCQPGQPQGRGCARVRP